MVKRAGFELSLVVAALDHGWQIDEKGQLLLSNDTRNVHVRMLTRTAKKIAELEEQLKKLEEQTKAQPEIVRCEECVYRGNPKKCILAFVAEKQDFPVAFYDNHGNWFCADGKPKESDPDA